MEVAAYEAYRESGIKWMPEIPSSWDDSFVKICFDVQLGKMLQSKPNSYEDVETPYLKAQHVNWNGVTVKSLPLMFASETEIQKFEVKNGDLLVCEGGEVGRAAILAGLEDVAIIQNALHRVRGTKLGDVGYFNYLLRNIADAGWFAILCNKATIAHLTGEKLGAIRIPVPSRTEQTQIAKLLDYKTAQIDRLIEKKKALIEKLNEQRIAMITQAVTKGLNPDAPMKDSEVDWLGEVPEDWEVRKLKFMAKIQNGSDYKHVEVHENEDGYPVYGSGGAFRKASEYLYDGSSVLFGRKGTIDKPILVQGKFWTVDTMFYSEIDKNTDCRFLYYSALTIQFQMLATQTALPSITQHDLSNYLLAFPNKNEQSEIADHIDSVLVKIKGMVEVNNKTIDKLNEYRTSLITAAVTGKIDVREVEIPKQGAA